MTTNRHTRAQQYAQLDDYMAQVGAHLAEVQMATKEVRREEKRLRGAIRRGTLVSYDLLQTKLYSVGAAARWFLTLHAPLVNPSPSLSAEDADTSTGRKGEHPSDGVI